MSAGHAHIDAQERRHLLIQVPDNTAPLSQQQTRGLEVSASRYRVGSDPEALYVDLVCVAGCRYMRMVMPPSSGMVTPVV